MWSSTHSVPVLLLAGAFTAFGLPQRDAEGLQACGEAFYYVGEVRDTILLRFCFSVRRLLMESLVGSTLAMTATSYARSLEACLR